MAICPFFDHEKTYCDVGEDYISPYDVVAMSHYCSGGFHECDRYEGLKDRHPQVVSLTGRKEAEEVTTERVKRGRRDPVAMTFSSKWPLAYRLKYATAYRPLIIHRREETSVMQSAEIKNRGVQVLLAGLGINLALGILYTWSIFKGAIADSIATGGSGAFNWDAASVNDPYAVACLAFAVAMILAGKCQDRFGPKVTCIIGGILVGLGFTWISQTTNYWAWVVGFGVFAGGGIGFGYSAATPPALKWFSPAKTGLIAGIVVSGFGLASVYIAPLAKYLLAEHGLQQAMLFFGVAFAVVVCSLALLIVNPPQGFVADGQQEQTAAKKSSEGVDLTPLQLFKNGRFYALWLCYFIGAGAGLMVIGSAKGLAKASMGEMAFLVVVIMSIGNAAGRLVAGVVSDRIGRATTLTMLLVFQALLMFAAIPVLGNDNSHPALVALLVTAMVFNYGTNLSLFPSFAKDSWGMKNFGMNYGILFSAWGVGAFVLVRVSEMLKVKTGSMDSSFLAAGVLLLVGAMMAMSLRPQKAPETAAETVGALADDEELVTEQIKG